jgi:hypothetical protein
MRIGAVTFSWASVRISIVTSHYALVDYGMMWHVILPSFCQRLNDA